MSWQLVSPTACRRMSSITYSKPLGTTLRSCPFTVLASIICPPFMWSIWQRKKETVCCADSIDCFSVLQNLADRQLKTRYVVATDTSKDTLIRITRKISQTLGLGKVKSVEQEDAMLNRDITVMISRLQRRCSSWRHERTSFIVRQKHLRVISSNRCWNSVLFFSSKLITICCQRVCSSNRCLSKSKWTSNGTVRMVWLRIFRK